MTRGTLVCPFVSLQCSLGGVTHKEPFLNEEWPAILGDPVQTDTQFFTDPVGFHSLSPSIALLNRDRK